ncbi:MAG TPA: RNA methyltransferase [Symbiobacteriaceae bacterium]|nr:RNA methyltransferase [Symbiobacteriaceae bacterium]
MITSRSNPTIKAIRLLRQRSERARTGLMLADGTQLVGEAIQNGMEVVQIIVAPDRVRSPFAQEMVRTAVTRGAQYLEVSDDVYESLTDSEGRQGLSAVIRQRWTPLHQVRPVQGHTWVAMNAVQYPGNLGTMLRTLDSVGGAGLILLGHCTDPYDPAAARASLGAVFSLQMVSTDQESFAAWKRQWGVHLVAADLGATLSYREAAYPEPAVLLMGAERDGLTPEQKELCDTMVYIPMVGRRDSLNVAVAASLILYEIFHRSQVPAGQ